MNFRDFLRKDEEPKVVPVEKPVDEDPNQPKDEVQPENPEQDED